MYWNELFKLVSFAIIVGLVVFMAFQVAYWFITTPSDSASDGTMQTLTCHEISGVLSCNLDGKSVTCSAVGNTIVCQIPVKGESDGTR